MTSTLDDEDLSLSMPGARRPSRDTPRQQSNPITPQLPGPAQRTPQSDRNKKAMARLGQYNVLRTLGEGSFGKVKLAVHSVSNQQVALKIISRRKLITRDMAGRIEREIQYLQLLRHPHIIKLYTVITTPNDIIMVLEYAGGELFDYIVQNGKMQENKARKFFQQIVCAVEYCHRHKIVHRDLKPENLLLDENLNVKIADFGLSNIMTDGNFLKTSCGSPNYAAPEVISGKLYAGPEVDVWSCGVILYVLLVGRLPFDDEYIPALFKKIAQGAYNVPSYLSPGAVHLVKRMLQINPVNRITIQEIRMDPWFKEDLAEYLQPAVEDFLDTGVDPTKAIDPAELAKGKPVAVQEQIHESVVGKLGKTMGYAPGDVQEALSKDEPSAIKDAYLIVRENHLMKTNPSVIDAQPEFPNSPPPFLTHMATPPTRPASSITAKESAKPNEQAPPRHTSFSAETRSPATTVAILPSSLPGYHAAFMKGHIDRSYSEATVEDDPQRPRTKEEQDATARRLKPHSKSSANLNRSATDKPEPMTNIADGHGGKPAKKVRPTKWQFGIRSRNSPAEAMLAIYRALVKMGAQWEVPKPKEMDNPESAPSTRSNSPEYSDSDPGSGTDPEYATHEEQERRRASRRNGSHDSGEARGRKRPGKWNGWGYNIPDDPWVIHARFKKDGMFAPGVPHPASAHGSMVSLHDRRASVATMTMANNGGAAYNSQVNSAHTSTENVAHTGPGSINSRVNSMNSTTPKPQESVWVYVTIQLYAIEADFFLVDFKCAGYERLVRRFAREVTGSNESDIITRDLAEGEDYGEGDMEEDEEGHALIGAGRPQDDKEITSPFPFLDVASRLIIQLAEAND
ncbi:carbon catabolite derepressing protein kinase Snf1 [Zymoseptoria brevis]|uniref:non-specific serine/threonine protein kinase n=1 Tax=Zymoseptoria brevis TaxID=1047168 RepID=A0A0F4GEK5_9PEZI|nr:carbon catabolite derepressing protein kinase Snf1 [Zymoseptoria brevis]